MPPSSYTDSARKSAIQWAQAMIHVDPLIVDVETTGFRNADIVQIGIIDMQGQVLMDQLLRPRQPIPRDATAIHGISDDMVNDAPELAEVYEEFMDLVNGQVVVAYNADFEKRMLRDSYTRYQLTPVRPERWECAMIAYASFYGEWNPQRRSFRWHKLTNACAYEGIAVTDAHRAVGDCRLTLELIRRMAAQV